MSTFWGSGERITQDGRDWVPADEHEKVAEALQRAEEAAQRWFNMAMEPNAAQRAKIERLSGDGRRPASFHPLWDVPDGSLLFYRLAESGGAGFIEIIEPEPTGRFATDMGVS